MADEEESFLQRWARRKAKARERTPAQPHQTELPQTTTATAVPATAAPEPLPSIDDLTNDSDFTPFLKEGVPEEMKRLALRKLWRSDPVFANLDGLVEYGEDFGAPFRNTAAVATLFRLGQGMPGPEEAVQQETQGPDDSTVHKQSEEGSDQPSSPEDVETPPSKDVADSDPTAVG